MIQRNKSFGVPAYPAGTPCIFKGIKGKITEYIKGAAQNARHGKGSIIMSVLSVTSEAFEKEVINSDKPVLVDFYADWCGPCRMVIPIVEEIARERADIKVGKINVDEQPELASQFGVMSIPTLVVMENGKIIQQISGARPKNAILGML